MTTRALHRTARAALCVGLSLGLALPAGAARASAAAATDGSPAADDADDAATGADAPENASEAASLADEAGPPPPDSDAPPARAALNVDTSALGAQSPVLLRRIEELGDIELRRAEILPSRHSRDPVIAIALRPIADGGYVITSHLTIAGEVVANSEHEVQCTLCTEGETVERARIEVGRLIPFVRDHARAEAEASEAQARARGDETGPAATPTDDRRGLAPMSKAGVALLVAGAAGLGLGLGLALRQPTVKPEMPLELTDTRVPGYVALGVGGALMVTGVALLVAGQRRARTRAVSFAPTPGGALLYGRF